MIKRRAAATESAALDLLPHVSGDGDHGVFVAWGDARTRAADRRARLPEDDEALRPDGGHDHRRRDRAHRDLGGGRPARRRAPRDVRAASRDGRAARCRVRHVGCRVARTLDSVLRLRLFSPGGWGVSAARRWRAAPTRVGALWQHTRSGELCSISEYAATSAGSSPRMRGTLGELLQRKSRTRIIPAHAGNSYRHALLVATVNCRGAPPRRTTVRPAGGFLGLSGFPNAILGPFGVFRG